MTGLANVLVRVAIELFDRSNRIKLYLTRVDPGVSHEYDPLTRIVLSALKGIEDTVTGSLEFNRRLKPDADKNIAQNAAEELYEDLETFSRWLANIHELLSYLPRENIAAETVYALRTAFGEDLYRSHNPSIILGSTYNLLEYDFLEIVRERLPDLNEIIEEEPGSIVLQLPICDRDCPSAWAVLAHELGHAIDLSEGISRVVVAELTTGLSIVQVDQMECWVEELAADLIAAHALGVAPILELLAWEYCVLPLRPSYYDSKEYETHPQARQRRHPSTRWRLKAVAGYILEKHSLSRQALDFLTKEVGSFESAWRFQLDRVADPEKRKRIEEEDDSTFSDVIQPVVRHLAEKINALKLPLRVVKKESMDRCLSRLSKGHPIGSQGARREDLQAEIEKYRDLKLPVEQRITPFRDLLDRFKESPLDLTTILCSARRGRIEAINSVASRDRPYPDSNEIENLCKTLNKIDKAIASSIRGNSVHVEQKKRLETQRV